MDRRLQLLVLDNVFLFYYVRHGRLEKFAIADLKIRPLTDRALSSTRIYLLISRSRKTALLFDILPMYFVERAVPRRNSPN